MRRRFIPMWHIVVAFLLLLWFLMPLVPLLLWAGADGWDGASRLPERWSFGPLRDAWRGEAAGAFARSLVLGSAVAALATPAGALAARALALRRVRRARLVSVLLLAPLAVPAFAVVMGLNVVLLRLHVPTSIGILLVLVVVALPYTCYVMRVAYGAYDVAFEEEARTLGASPWAVTWRVRLPLLGPGVASATFLAFLVGYSDYIVTLAIGGGRFVTVPILVASAASGTGNEPTVAALSLGALAPPTLALVAATLARRRLGRQAVGSDEVGDAGRALATAQGAP